MSEEKRYSLYEEQKKTKPEVETVISEALDGDLREGALAFAAYCRANKMKPMWSSGNIWTFKYKGKRVGSIRVRVRGMLLGKLDIVEHSWYVHVHYLDMSSPAFEKFATDEALQDVVWKNAKHCESCLTTCAPGRDRVIAGRLFHNICVADGIYFKNPDDEAMECVRKLIEYRKSGIT